MIQIDNRPRCRSKGVFLGELVPCDLERDHPGNHRWHKPMSWDEYEWTDNDS